MQTNMPSSILRITVLLFTFCWMSAAAPNTYYVDATGGADTNNGASPASAWKTVSKVLSTTLLPDDTVLFKRGGTWKEELIPRQSGAPGHPITFADYGVGDKPLLDGEGIRNGVHAYGISFITIRNIAVIRGKYGFWIHGGSAYNVLDSVESSFCTLYDGISFQDPGSIGNRVLNSTAHDQLLGSGVTFYPGADNGTVIGGTYYNNKTRHASGVEFDTSGNRVSNVVSYNNWYGIKVYGSGALGNVVENSISHHNESFGIDVDYAGPANIVQNNVSYSNASHGIAIELATDAAIVRYNVTHDNGRPDKAGIELDETTNVQVYYNVSYGEYNGIWTLNAVNASIYNNTVHNAFECYLVERGSTGITLKNNIASACSRGTIEVTADSQSGLQADFNNWFDGGAENLIWGGFHYGLTLWKIVSSQDRNSIDPDPQFVNAAGRDFHLQSSSPGINAGATIGLTADLSGTSVPQGNSIDMGAYEYITAGGPTPGVTGLSCNPGSVVTPGTAKCTITLAGAAPSGGVAVFASSNNSSAAFSSPVTVPSGQTSASFTLTGTAVTTDTLAMLTAIANGTAAKFSLGLLAPIDVTSLSCNPTILSAGASANCTVALSRMAPTGGLGVTISNDSSALSYLSPVMVPADSNSVVFTVTAAAVTDNQQAMLAASIGASSQSIPLSVVAPTWLNSLACSPEAVTGGTAVSCAVTLSQGAPVGGLMVSLGSNNGSVLVPASVTVGAGAMSASFSAVTSAVSELQTATVTSTVNGQPVTASVTVLPTEMSLSSPLWPAPRRR